MRVENPMEVKFMKEIKELKFEELSVEQKLGMIHSAVVSFYNEEQTEFVFNQIKNHALGAIWIPSNDPNTERFLKRVKETADYPILVMTDAENGLGDYKIGLRNCVGRTYDEKNAYAFGKSVGVVAKEQGFNVVGSPILDIDAEHEGSPRKYHSTKEWVAKMAAAEARGMRDAGLMAVGKHYPGARDDLPIDSHMAEALSLETKEELMEEGLYVYKSLIDQGLLDGIMTSHHKVEKIDPVYPASLSKKVIDIIKEEGFDGFFITDAIDMMGVRAKFGAVDSKGLAIMAGNDFVLTYSLEPIRDQEIINECYKKGIITDERLDEAVKKVLAMQHKALEMDKNRATSLTEDEIERMKTVEKKAVCVKADEGLTASISRDGRHAFEIMIKNDMDPHGVDVDTFKSNWLFPDDIKKQILELFPNSHVHFIHQLPSPVQNLHALCNAQEYDDVVFLSFAETLAYIGKDHFTSRIVALLEAMQYTDRIAALVHFGNPTVLEALPHIPRYILGDTSVGSVKACLEVLAGEYEPEGKPTCEYTLN